MIGAGHAYRVMTPAEEDTLHRNVRRIVAEVGLQVENETLLDRMAAIGGRVDPTSRRVTFSEAFTDDFIASSPRYDWSNHRPTVSADAGIFEGKCLDPVTDEFLPLTPDRARDFYRVARAMPHTAEWLRREAWEPELWDRKGFSAWRQQDGHTDIDRVKARVNQILEQPGPPDFIGEDEKGALENVLRKAQMALAR